MGLLLLLVPAWAFAEGGGGLSQQSYQAIITLLAVASLGFIVAQFVSDWLQRRFGIVTGVEYIVVGALLSPSFANFGGFDLKLLTSETLTQLTPALILGQGSVGLLAGVILNFRDRDSVTFRAVGLGAMITLATLLVVSVLPLGIAAYIVGLDEAMKYAPHLLCLGAVASVASQSRLRSLIVFLDARGDGAALITRVARSCSSMAVIAFGVIFCLSKPASDLVPGVSYGPWVDVLFWFAVHLGFGLVLGIIFTLFLLRDFEDEKILTVVIGMVIFTSGVAYLLKLSPIVVCFILGIVLANLSSHSEQVRQMLLSVERPLYIVIFVFVGASMQFDVAWWAWFAAIPYLALRSVGRGLGSVVGQGLAPSVRQLPPLGPALLAPGALSAAMLLNFSAVFSGQPLVSELYAALLLAIVAGEPIAYRLSRRWLIDATDVALSREPKK